MDRKVKSFRLRVDLLDWLDAYAKERGSTQIAVLESAIESFKGLASGGVPDLPVPSASRQVAPSEEDYESIMRRRQIALNRHA